LTGGKGSGFKSSLNPGERALASMNRIQEYSSAFDAMFFHASDGVVIGGGLPKEVKDLIQGKTVLSLSSASGCSSLFCSIYKARSEEQKDKTWWEEKKDKTSVNEFATNILTEDFIRSNNLLATGDLAQRFQAAELSSAPTSLDELERLMAQSRTMTQTALPAAKKCIAYDSALPPNCTNWSP